MRPLFNPFLGGAGTSHIIDTQNRSLFSHRSSVVDSPCATGPAINIVSHGQACLSPHSSSQGTSKATPKLPKKNKGKATIALQQKMLAQ